MDFYLLLLVCSILFCLRTDWVELLFNHETFFVCSFSPIQVGTDDTVDKLGRRHVVTALALTTVVVAGSEYIGSPINCFTPNGYTGNQVIPVSFHRS